MISSQIDANQDDSDLPSEFCTLLPSLPTVLRYYDDFDDSLHSISNPAEQSTFELAYHGRIHYIKFEGRSSACIFVLKHVLALMLSQDLSSATISSYFSQLHHLEDEDIKNIICSTPLNVVFLWKELRSREMSAGAYLLAKHILHLMCVYRWRDWSAEYRSFLATSLPLPTVDKYASVRSGSVFLSINHEAKLVQFLDNLSARLTAQEQLPAEEVASAGMLLSAYQYAMRPVQIGMLDLSHVRIWKDGISDIPTVHL